MQRLDLDSTVYWDSSAANDIIGNKETKRGYRSGKYRKWEHEGGSHRNWNQKMGGGRFVEVNITYMATIVVVSSYCKVAQYTYPGNLVSISQTVDI